MKIIHSSDFHLNTAHPERTDALDSLISMAKKEEADLILISGDFFDSNVEAEKLRPVLRDKLSLLPFKILLIPGNHDSGCYQADLNFGNDIEVFTGNPFEVFETKEVRIIAVPYRNQSFNQIVPSISVAVFKDKINILLIHCTLDIPYLMEDGFGDEKKQNYLPVSSKVLADLNIDYIMAGHFHSRAVENKISEKSTFLYSGSPVSITKKESGKRSVYLLDTSIKNKGRIKAFPVDSFYYDFAQITLKPGKENEGISRLETALEGMQKEKAEFEITVSGLVSISEIELKEQIGRTLKKFHMSRKETVGETTVETATGQHPGSKIRILEQYRSVKDVINDPLYNIFKEKLLKTGISGDQKDRIDETVMIEFSKIKYLK